MSEERELLKRLMIELTTEKDVVSLFNDIKELLAQPEQTEQKPLSETAVCEILIKKEWKGFVELVRIIEKAHGIGGGE